MTAGWLIFLCILLPWLGALLVWVVGDRYERIQHGLAVFFSLAGALAALALLGFASQRVVIDIPAGDAFGHFTFVADGLGSFLTAIAASIGCLAVVFSVDYMRSEAQLGRYYSQVLLFIGAMCGLVLTSNLLLIFFFWELTALTSYALISFFNDDPKAVAGGMKALLITQLGGIGLLAGALLSYAYLGSFDMAVLLEKAGSIPANVLMMLAFGFLAAAAAKSAQFPFQTWLPDAMEAPTPVSALIHAATMVNAGIYLLIRFYPAFAEVPYWRLTVMLVGVLTALLAALMALVAIDLKRVLAYSTVSQLGFMVYAVGAGGVFAASFHLLSHAIFKALLFLAAGAVIHAVGTRDMRQMGGLGKRMPFVRAVFVVGALALAGIPILNGFWSKELILEAGLAHGPVWLFVVMVLTAGITALYTVRCVWLVFFGSPQQEHHVHPSGVFMKIALLPLALGALLSWLPAQAFSSLLEGSLPFHDLHLLTLSAMAAEVLGAPATWLTLAVIGLGIAIWFLRAHPVVLRLTANLNPIGSAASASFGFEWINQAITRLIRALAEDIRDLQTGLIGWNVYGILAALIMVLVIVAAGAR